MSIITLNRVSYKYQKTTKNVLSDVNAEFDKGKVYGIIGKSGAGKSTVLSLISGLDNATGGEIDYNGTSLNKLDRDKYRAKSIGVIFQGYNLLSNATALENIVLAMNISGSKIHNKKEFALDLLSKVGIDAETANRKVQRLSGGEQQRVGIARAISHDPDVVIADEPTGNLDSKTERNIMDILIGLAHDEGKCVIIVTHSKSVARFVDVLMELSRGTLINRKKALA